MAKGRGRDRTIRRRRKYIGTIALASLLTLTFVTACLIIVTRGSLLLTLNRIAADPSHVVPADLEVAGIALADDLAAACAVAICCALGIRGLRVLLYTHRMHRHVAEYLEGHAPLHLVGIGPEVVPFDHSGQPTPSGAAPLLRVATRSRHLLLLGSSGSGKTVALHAAAYELTRKRVAVRADKRHPLPVLVALADFARAQATSKVTLAEYLADLAERLGSPGLATQVPRLLRQGRLLALCDELDAVPLDRRSAVCTELAAIVHTYPRCTLVVACRLEDYEAQAGMRTALRPFDGAMISGLNAGQIHAALRHARLGGAKTRPRRGAGSSPLARHALDVSATLPAQLAALRALASAPDVPNGRGELWRRYLDQLLPPAGDTDHHEGSESLDHPGHATAVLAQFAAALRATDKRSAEILTGEHTGEAVAAAIAGAHPLPAPGGRSADLDAASDEQIRSICETSLKAGILVTSDHGGGVSFSNGVTEAAYAARWLALSDDGFGTPPPELLRPEWYLPLLLWSSAAGAASADLAKRVLRLADTPDVVALRAGLSSPEDAVPLTLAVALAVLAEGAVAFLARERGASPELEHEQAVQIVNDHLRDVLDLAQIYIAQPESAERLSDMLLTVNRTAGAEVAPNLVRLATATEMTRLVRSQVITLLGLMATPPALEGLTELLGEMDPVIRQGVNQAYVSAGTASLPYLERASRQGNTRARERAAEVLAAIGGGAASSAVELLTSGDERQRALAAATLGTLRARSAEQALLGRLDDASSEVRAAAARALGRLASGAGLEAVAARAQSDDPHLRAAVAEAIGIAQETQYMPAVLSLLGDRAVPVRAAAATALGLLADERAVGALEAACNDEDVWVRNAAQIALRRLGRSA